MSGSRSDSPEDLFADAAWVRRLAVGLAGDAHRAEDLAQETWVAALEHGGLAGRPARSWLAGVMRNLSRRSKRTAARRDTRERDSARNDRQPSVSELVERVALHRDLVDAVMALDEPFRMTVLMRYLEEMPPREIAASLDVPVRTVNSRLQRGLERLREGLDRRQGGREGWLACFGLAGESAAAGSGTLAGVTLMGMKAKVAVAAGAVALAAVGVHQVIDEEERPAPAVAERADPSASRFEEPASELAAAPSDEAGSSPRVAVDAEPAAGPTGIRISGRVINAGYAPLGLIEGPANGLVVQAVVRKSRVGFGLGPGASETTTRADGSFELLLDDPGYRPAYAAFVVREAGGYRMISTAEELAEGVTALEDVRLVRGALGLLEGTTVDHDGEPLEGVRVTARVSEGTLETFSDADGRFVFERPSPSLRLSAELPGYALFEADAVVQLAEGGFDPVELRFVPAERVVVRVIDPDELPVEGAKVYVKLDPSEQRGPSLFSGPPALSAETGADGVAVFDDVWTERKLTVQVSRDDRHPKFDKVQGGRLVPAKAKGGELLILARNASAAWTARLGREIVLRGAVAFPDGHPVPKPSYQVMDGGRPEWEMERVLAFGTGELDGTFEERLAMEGVVGPIDVLVGDGEVRPVFAGRQSPLDHARRLSVDPATAVDGVLAVQVVLEPTYAIAGVLRDEEGEPFPSEGFGNRVYAVPAGAGFPYAMTDLGRQAWAFAEEGAFRITGLSAGVYDVYASRELESFYTFSTALHRFPDVPAGSENVELRVPAAGEVSVRFRVRGGDVPVEGMIVLIGTFHPRDGREPPADGAPARLEGGGLTSWPEGALWRFTGAAGGDDATGRNVFSLYSTDDATSHTLPPLGEGWYVFGVQASGLSHFPIATGLAYFRQGEYEVDFRLTPVASLRGKLVSAQPVAHLAVAIVDDGEPLLTYNNTSFFGKMDRTTAVNAAGEFELSTVPVGTRTLRVGTRAQLEAGEFAHEVSVNVGLEGNEPLEIRF